MSAPVLSVVIAAYNAEHTLAAQLDALRAQSTAEDWEVIVADNGSTDGTVRLVESWATTWPQLRWIDASADRGPAGARNLGARHAEADALAFCDADDVVQPGWVAGMIAGLVEHDLVSGVSRRPHFNARPGSPPLLEWSWYTMPFLPQLPAAGAGNLGIRTSLFTALGGFDRRLATGEDLDLCWRAQLAGASIGLAPGAIVDVSNRDTVLASFRQTFRYGAGERQLQHKYAHVIAALRGTAGTPPPVAAPTTPATATAATPGRWRAVARMRRPSDAMTAVRWIGVNLGRRIGRIDTSMARLPAPAARP